MSKATTAIFPIENGKLITPLDCNNLQLLNLDESNLSGGGGGGGGNDTGTTTAILKGDGNHGFADAVADVDYSTPAALGLKENITEHDADIALVNADIATINTALGTKANSSDVTTALALKADQTALTAYITSNNAAVALKANSSDVTTALALKADTSALTSGLAGKEPTLPTTANDSWILARHNAGSGSSWFFVDPVSLGTTNQSFVDGQSFTNTNFDSASAQFNSGDIGKTITGTNIPAATTISSITSATRVVLSQATTGTGSSLSFTIFNRLTVAGGGGTVTSVSVNNDIANTLFGTSVSNPTTSATIGITMSTTVAANAAWGNPNAFPAAATFMTPAQQRTSLGATTTGSNLLQIANPNPGLGVASWIKIDSSNVPVAQTAAVTKSDLGAENILTFSAPLARATNTISMPAATDAVSGHLTAADHTAFNAKVPGGRLLTMTAPLLIDGVASASLASDRTISMPASASNVDGTGQVSGYLRGTDFFNFLSKPPSNRIIGTTLPLTGGGDLSGNRTIVLPKATSVADGYLAAADFNLFSAGSGSTGTTFFVTNTSAVVIPTQTPPVIRVIFNVPLTQTVLIGLPPAASYGSALNYPFIEFVDNVTGGAFSSASAAAVLTASGGNTIDGTTNFSMPKGMTYLRINSNGLATNQGRWATTKYFVDSFKDGNNVDNIVTLNISAPGTLTLGSGPSVTVNPTDAQQPGVVFDILGDGSVSKAQLRPTDLLPQEYTVGTAGQDIASGASFTISDSGGIDTVRIAGRLTGPISILWPTASFYSLGEAVTLFDASGSLAQPSRVVTVNHSTTSSDTFNGVNSFIFDEANGRKVLTSDHASNWAVSLVKTSILPFGIITPTAGNTFTLVADRNAVKQNAHLTLLNGANALAITAPFDGMSIELVIVQPSSGAQGTLTLPLGSYVASGGGGVISLTATNNAIDRLRGSYDGFTGTFLWDTPILNHTTTPVPAAPSGIATGSITASQVVLTWTDNSNNETGFSIERQNVTLSLPYAEITQTGAGVVTYKDTGVSPSTQYNYRIRAFNAGGFSTYNGPASATTSAGGPTADLWELHFNDGSGLIATHTIGPDASLIYADWTTSTQSGTGAAFAPTAGMAPTTGNPGAVVVGTGGTTTWTYKVLAFKNVSGLHNVNGIFSTGALGNAVLNGANLNRITWNAVTGADYYSVYRTVATGGTPSTLGRLTGTGPGFTAVTFDDTGIATDGNALPFDAGSATDVHTATAQSAITYGTNLISVTFWGKSTYSTTGVDTIVAGSSGGNIFKIAAIAGAKFQISYNTGSGVKTATVPNGTAPSSLVNDNLWHLICVTMDNSQSTHLGTEIKVYYDGSSTARTSSYTATGTGPLTFPSGAPQIGSQHFSGSIDDVRIYNHILSAGEMTLIFGGNAQ